MRAIFGSSVRAGTESRAVTPLELFFDLVFVFAIGQLSHRALATAVLLAVAVSDSQGP